MNPSIERDTNSFNFGGNKLERFFAPVSAACRVRRSCELNAITSSATRQRETLRGPC